MDNKIKQQSATNANTRWRTSASLILVAPAAAASEDYNLLMLKRSEATAVAQNQTVFPGGLLDVEGDESVAWLEYFEQFGVSQESLRSLILISEHRPGILAPQGNGCYDRFFKRSKIWAREITLRLTALRECFEEVGILICRSRAQLNQLDAVALTAQFQPEQQHFDRESWQRRVHNKPSEFLELCRELQVVPDLWALHEWSAWASPAIVKKGHETVFFMVFLDSQPILLAEPTEVKECLWRTPVEFLRMYQHEELWLMPPQIYELLRLLAIPDYRKLLHFATQRSILGTTLFLPVGYNCSDGMVFALPGDELYVAEPHLAIEPINFPGSADELRARSTCLHRYEFTGPTVCRVHLNIPAPNGHLLPQNLPNPLHKL
ncbi:nucleoside diphosphate-linked moiety X motif 19 [Drosophila novamexicana]|uniref:nucleoside diphosphate-linked moiety X motif 19 n=1 Tax=Drosophila novamexicana TaxID=47314 RepID=UPI0011E5E0D3|nr:nucleoside diphosphate-linked moiety X motif 19 [Drosophila novamexicana]